MATPEDLRVNADFIRMADQYLEVPAGSNNNVRDEKFELVVLR